VPGEEFIIGNNDGEDVGVTKKTNEKVCFFFADEISGLYLLLVLVNHF
jgi:hypothetical protein